MLLYPGVYENVFRIKIKQIYKYKELSALLSAQNIKHFS